MDMARLRIRTPSDKMSRGQGKGRSAIGESRKRILAEMEAHGPLAPVELQERLGLSTGVVGYHLARMEREGLLARTLRAGRLCYQPAGVQAVDGRAGRPEAVARKVKTLQQLSQILEPRIAQVLREIEADYASLLAGGHQ